MGLESLTPYISWPLSVIPAQVDSTLWAMAIAARMVGEIEVLAVLADIERAAELGCATFLDVTKSSVV